MLAADSHEPLEGWKATYMFNFQVRIINSGQGLISTPVLPSNKVLSRALNFVCVWNLTKLDLVLWQMERNSSHFFLNKALTIVFGAYICHFIITLGENALWNPIKNNYFVFISFTPVLSFLCPFRILCRSLISPFKLLIYPRDFKLQPRSRWELCSFGLLRSE